MSTKAPRRGKVNKRVLVVGRYRSEERQEAIEALLPEAFFMGNSVEPHANLITKAMTEDCAVMVFAGLKFARLFFRLPPEYSPLWSAEGNYVGAHLFNGRKRLMVILKNPIPSDDGIVMGLEGRVSAFLKGV